MRQNFSLIWVLLCLSYSAFGQPSELAMPPQRGTFVDPRDQRTYKTVQIGTQVWLAENFAYLPKVDSVTLSVYDYKGNSLQKAKSTASYKTYGALYSWQAANELAPPGWHLPTDADWQQLEKHIGISQQTVNTGGWRGTDNVANRLKPGGDTGFNVVFGGWKTDQGEAKFQGQHANFWCADSYDTGRAIERLLGVNNGKIGRDVGNKGCGFSVRYVRDRPAEEAIYFPAKSWEYLQNAAAYGWDKDKWGQLTDFVRDSTQATGLVVIQSGKILYEYGNTEELSYIASVRKSILAMLYGRYVEKGTIRLTKTLAELGIDDVGGLSIGEKKATVLDLLKSKSGVYHAASNEGGNEFLFPQRGSQAPGSYYVYNNWDFNTAGYVFEKETGLSIYDAFEKDIAQPIGLEDWDKSKQYRSGDTTKSQFKAYHFVFSTRDMARLGYLMLRQGQWQHQSVIPHDWVRQLTTLTTRYEEMKQVDPRLKEWPWWPWGYGLMWRLWDSPQQKPAFNKAFTATGNMGQYITVLPEMDLVIALKTKADYGRRTEYETYLRFLTKLISLKD